MSKTIPTRVTITERLLRYFRSRPTVTRALELAILPFEIAGKKPIFGCRMCGQCILHETGLTCPMGCPKTLRNGPCGGVRMDGHCEVIPDMSCVWVKAERRSRWLPWRDSIFRIQPALDWTLRGSSAWVNVLIRRNGKETS
ncbi:MAG TPA: methylenetetrahydrofolate reductase C-terminal domain-containing protein [Candidatus Polarisedimenticolia bacterium]|nr:methylenetetrahydrofolate reductase C-terminal domain-containing protein [Candidatus Polarisedimenticolia bacterium]